MVFLARKVLFSMDIALWSSGSFYPCQVVSARRCNFVLLQMRWNKFQKYVFQQKHFSKKREASQGPNENEMDRKSWKNHLTQTATKTKTWKTASAAILSSSQLQLTEFLRQCATNNVTVRGDDVLGTSLQTCTFDGTWGDDVFGTSLLQRAFGRSTAEWESEVGAMHGVEWGQCAAWSEGNARRGVEAMRGVEWALAPVARIAALLSSIR